MTNSTTLTKNEKHVLTEIIESDYQDGTEVVDNSIYFNVDNTDLTPRVFAGVMGSLNKKELIWSSNSRDYNSPVAYITQKGYDTLQESQSSDIITTDKKHSITQDIMQNNFNIASQLIEIDKEIKRLIAKKELLASQIIK